MDKCYLILVIVNLTGHSSCLECWTCVGQDCGDAMSSSKFAHTTKCEAGAECQKTYFYYYDFVKNASERMGPVRSCSYPSGCSPLDEFTSGICDNWKFYQSLGCVQRYCCSSDLCNQAPKVHRDHLNPWILCTLILSLRLLTIS